ncbi:hypothetical protein JRQ81_002823 [Phrynocephalus forsythii]|uniref:Uncharacterized protein n=1 Tax=Phrynocephalus forsythii TaxID=171643 RepID=A0A9Q0XJD2_9SAUR|nr:hypothetical protein JRQ81_002823 [Phrynocephalus forsythii]
MATPTPVRISEEACQGQVMLIGNSDGAVSKVEARLMRAGGHLHGHLFFFLLLLLLFLLHPTPPPSPRLPPPPPPPPPPALVRGVPLGLQSENLRGGGRASALGPARREEPPVERKKSLSGSFPGSPRLGSVSRWIGEEISSRPDFEVRFRDRPLLIS